MVVRLRAVLAGAGLAGRALDGGLTVGVREVVRARCGFPLGGLPLGGHARPRTVDGRIRWKVHARIRWNVHRTGRWAVRPVVRPVAQRTARGIPEGASRVLARRAGPGGAGSARVGVPMAPDGVRDGVRRRDRAASGTCQVAGDRGFAGPVNVGDSGCDPHEEALDRHVELRFVEV
ncbi:hypothetical protein [Nonomuraea lactucae]|uniref:hypothetical protein n=1 Tax=Nonomuraea lactucae TaxID=2249762 RepID=UPI000DE2AF28|nr:hypothetical protein [Nonomuraea lactucae]